MKVSLTSFQVPYHLDGSLYGSIPYGLKPGETHRVITTWDYSATPPGRVTRQTPYDILWLPNNPFTLPLTIMSEEDHRRLKEKTVWWVADDGRKFPMFANNLASTLLKTNVAKGRTDPIEWVVRKHGREFGILPYEA